jgi:hypothetical protein
MTFIGDDEIDALTIEQMIFHVVGPDEGDLYLLDEIDPKGHEEFFLDRVKYTCSGNLFDFHSGSSVRERLYKVQTGSADFVEESKNLAQQFQSLHEKRTKKGVFLVLRLETASSTYFSVIKYDHESVLTYDISSSPEGRQAVMSDIENTFVRNPEAMQKSGFMYVNGEGGSVYVRDRSDPKDITTYFRGFLGVNRRSDPPKLTHKLFHVALKTASKHKKDLPAEVQKNVQKRIYDTINNQEGYDPENSEAFLTGCYGALPKDSPVRKTFNQNMNKEKINREAFKFDVSKIPKPSRTRWKTKEGVELFFTQQQRNQYINTRKDGHQTIIEIKTEGIQEDDVVTEPN